MATKPTKQNRASCDGCDCSCCTAKCAYCTLQCLIEMLKAQGVTPDVAAKVAGDFVAHQCEC